MLAAARLARATPRSSARSRRRVVARLKGADLRRAPLHAAVRLLRAGGRHENAHQVLVGATTSPPRTARHRAHGARVRRGRQGRVRGRRASPPVVPVDPRASSPPRCRRTSASRCSTRTSRSSPTCGAAHAGRVRAAAPRDLRALLPALLALPEPADLQGGVELVRRGDDFRDRMVELNQDITWMPEHIKDGQFGKWLANARDWSISRNRYWGTPDPGVGVGRPDVPAGRRLRLAGRAGARLRRGGRPTCTARSSTS